MRRRFGQRSPAVLGCALALVWVTATSGVPGQTLDSDALRVCLLDDDLPRSSEAGSQEGGSREGQPSGFDYELGQALAERLGLRFVPVWRPSSPSFSEIEDSELPLGDLERGDCDVLPSVPGTEALGDLAGELELIGPYYGAAFELVTIDRDTSVGTFGELRGETVAVRLQTLAHFALQRAEIDWLARPTTGEVLDLVESGTATVALVWGPALPRDALLVEDWQPPRFLRWNEHLAVSRRAPELRQRLEGALAQLLEDGALAEILQRYGVFRGPFETVFSAGSWQSELATLTR